METWPRFLPASIWATFMVKYQDNIIKSIDPMNSHDSTSNTPLIQDNSHVPANGEHNLIARGGNTCFKYKVQNKHYRRGQMNCHPCLCRCSKPEYGTAASTSSYRPAGEEPKNDSDRTVSAAKTQATQVPHAQANFIQRPNEQPPTQIGILPH